MSFSQSGTSNEEIQITLTVNGQEVTTMGKLILNIMPKPRAAIELNDLPLDTTVEPGVTYDFKLDNGNTIQAVCVSDNTYTIGPDTTRSSAFIPKGGCWTLVKPTKPLHSVTLKVVNFHNFVSGKYDTLNYVDNDISHSCTVPTVNLKFGKWSIRLTAVPNLHETLESIRYCDGYAYTHTGLITRNDGSSFSLCDVKELKRKLRLFLSYARGVFCGLTDIVGRDSDGVMIWREVGCPKVDPWHDSQAWFDRNQGSILNSVLDGFNKCMNKSSVGSRIEAGLHWYLLAHRGIGFLEPDIVVAQTSLELLSCVVLNRNKKQHEKTGVFIKDALDKLPVSAEVPINLSSLYDFAKEKRLEHGPHVLTELRNDMVHCQTNHEETPSMLLFEAKTLSLWYVELFLLKLFEYNGLYSNRLTRKWVGEVESVPWS